MRFVRVHGDARTAQSSAALPPATEAALAVVPQWMSNNVRRRGRWRSVASAIVIVPVPA